MAARATSSPAPSFGSSLAHCCCHRRMFLRIWARSAPKNPAAPLPPSSETPNLLGCAAPAVANWSSPARRRTATPSAAALDDRPDALRRYSPLQTPANPASPPRHVRKSKDALLPALLSRLVVANRLAPGCTPENWPSRAPPLPPV